MRQLRIIFIISIIFISALARAQFTTVTGTVIDPNSLPYSNGTINPILVAPGGSSVTLNGQPYAPPTQPSSLSSTGAFTMRLGDTSILQPAGTKWNFQVCSGPGATVTGAIGKGPICFTLAAPITISGSAQDISAQLQAVAPALSAVAGGGGGGTITGSGTANFMVMWTAPTVIGNSPCSVVAGVQTCPAFNLNGGGPLTLSAVYGFTPSVSIGGSSNLSVDPANGLWAESVNTGPYIDLATILQASPQGNSCDIQYNAGGSFGGLDAYCLGNSVTPPGPNYFGTSPTALIVGRSDAATNVLNQFSNVLQIQGNYWTGSVSAPDIWWIYEGARPNGGAAGTRSALVFNHTGTSGNTFGSNYNFVVSGDNSLDSSGSCSHEEPANSTNSMMCAIFGAANTAGSGSDLQLINMATSGSQRTRMIQSGNFAAGNIFHSFETDPNVTGAAEWGEIVSYSSPSANNYPYLFINGLSTNQPDLYLGGFAWGGATKAALRIGIDNGFGAGPVRRNIIPLVPLDFDSSIFTYEISGPNELTPSTPGSGQKGYFKSGSGWCALDTSGTERCTGSGGGGVSNVATGTGLTGGPITSTGTISLVVPVTTPLGGTGLVSPAAHSFALAEGASPFNVLSSPAVNGNYQCSFNVSGSTAVDPTCAQAGVPVNAQSGNYSLLYSDRASYIKESGGSTSTLTLPQITANNASNFPFVTQNLNSSNETLAANAADKIDGSGTGGTQSLLPNFAAFVYQDSSSAPGNWWTVRVPTFAAFGATCSNGTTWSTTTGFGCLSAAPIKSGDAAGGVLGGSYPNPTFSNAVSMGQSNTSTVYTSETTSTYNSADASADPVPNLAVPLQANTAVTYGIDCYGSYSQATAATVQTISYQSASLAPTYVSAWGFVATNTSAISRIETHAATSTGIISIGTFTPGAVGATNPFELHFTVVNPSGAASTLQVLWTSTTGATDVTSVLRAARCTSNTAVN